MCNYLLVITKYRCFRPVYKIWYWSPGFEDLDLLRVQGGGGGNVLQLPSHLRVVLQHNQQIENTFLCIKSIEEG